MNLFSRLCVAAPIRSNILLVDRKVFIAFIVSKYAIFEELIGQFSSVFVFNLFVFNFIAELIVNNANPGADAGQCPYIKLYIRQRQVPPELRYAAPPLDHRRRA